MATGRVPLLAGNHWGNNVSVEGFEKGPDTDANSRFNEISSPAYRASRVHPMQALRYE